MKSSGSFKLTIYNMSTLSAVHIIHSQVLREETALFEGKFVQVGIVLMKAILENHDNTSGAATAEMFLAA